MALQLGALRAALIEAGASHEKADRAAEELAGYEDHFAKLDLRMEELRGGVQSEFAKLRGEMQSEFAKLRGEMGTLRWMLGTVIALILGVLARLLFIH
jgi:hypothetical protein